MRITRSQLRLPTKNACKNCVDRIEKVKSGTTLFNIKFGVMFVLEEDDADDIQLN